jgi:hypothetical protein
MNIRVSREDGQGFAQTTYRIPDLKLDLLAINCDGTCTEL